MDMGKPYKNCFKKDYYIIYTIFFFHLQGKYLSVKGWHILLTVVLYSGGALDKASIGDVYVLGEKAPCRGTIPGKTQHHFILHFLPFFIVVEFYYLCRFLIFHQLAKMDLN